MATKKETKAKRLGNIQKVAWSLDELAAAKPDVLAKDLREAKDLLKEWGVD